MSVSLAVFGTVVSILMFLGLNQLIKKGVEDQMFGAMVARAKSAASQAESYSATASTYVSLLKTNVDESNRRLEQINASLKSEALSKLVNQIPVGTILPFAGTAIPEQWRSCDGAELQKRDYPDLFTAIKTIWVLGVQMRYLSFLISGGGFLREPTLTGAPWEPIQMGKCRNIPIRRELFVLREEQILTPLKL